MVYTIQLYTACMVKFQEKIILKQWFPVYKQSFIDRLVVVLIITLSYFVSLKWFLHLWSHLGTFHFLPQDKPFVSELMLDVGTYT